MLLRYIQIKVTLFLVNLLNSFKMAIFVYEFRETKDSNVNIRDKYL